MAAVEYKASTAMNVKAFFENGKCNATEQSSVTKCCDKGNILTHSVKDGMVICENCGSIKEQIYLHHPMFDESSSNYVGCDRSGLAEWTLRMTVSSEESRFVVIAERVSHWNTYINLKEDDVEFATLMVSEIEEKVKITTKAVTALLYVRNYDNINSWLKMRPSTPVRLPDKPLTFGSCDKCQITFGCIRDRRFHKC